MLGEYGAVFGSTSSEAFVKERYAVQAIPIVDTNGYSRMLAMDNFM